MLTEDNQMLHNSLMELISAWMVTAANKMLDITKFKAYSCQPTESRENDNRVCITVRIFSARCIDATATSDMNPSLLTDDSVPFLKGYGIPMTSVWFQQESARHHMRIVVLHFFYVSKETALLNILHYLRKDFHGHQTH